MCVLRELMARSLLAVVLVFLAVAAPSKTHAFFPEFVEGERLPSLAPVLERVTPAVVNLSISGPSPQQSPLMDDPFFRRFFGFEGESSRAPSQSLGSGVIVDSDQGLIITNHHVIENASQIKVTLHDGRTFQASIVGTDPDADVAVIRIDAADLVQLKWADSSQLRVGDFCIAIGNPFGLGQTVTSGIVSALGRSGLGIESFEDFIQTDASINPGNSGGALINLRGELIGINTAIVGPSGGNVGIGFAIPSNMAADLSRQIVEFGEVRRGVLGIAVQPLTDDLAQALGAKTGFGVVISQVQPESPAARAGLMRGDVITHIDDRPIRNLRALRNRIGLVTLGQQSQVRLIRNQETITVPVTVEELLDTHALNRGARLVNRRSANGRQFVQVEAVRPGSLVERSGIEPGDIILSINRQGVGTVRDLQTLINQAGDELVLLIQRGRVTFYAELPNK